MATKTKKPSTTKPLTTKKAPAIATGATILGRAMLVNVQISMWEGRKHDREVTQEVNAEHHATHDAGRYHKHLFGGSVPELSAIVTAAGYLRGAHYTQTLPWTDSGWRLLPTENYMEYTTQMRALIAKYHEAADRFETAYERRVRESEDKLGTMFRASDYPSASSVRHRYQVALQFSPLPAGDDFRVDLPGAEMAQMRKDVEDRMTKAVELATKAAWTRLGDAIAKLRPRLTDGKHLRDAMLDNLREVAEALGRLNITQDPALDVARTEVLQRLTHLDAETLRDNPRARTDAAMAADAILKSMTGVYTPDAPTPTEA